MPSRRWWIVVVLTAVFSMHGVLLISPSGGDAAVEDGAAQHAMAGSQTMVSLPDLDGTFVPGSPAASMATADEPLPDTDPGHGDGAHLWSLCLAILAGVALLGALLSGRAAAVAATAAVHLVRGVRRWPGLPRPPDLAALCLLRI